MRIIKSAIAILLLSTIVLAQTAQSNWTAVSAVAVGTKLKVKLKSGKTHEGTFTSANDSTLTLQIKNASTELKREDIATVHQRGKGSTTAATLIGLGIGAGAGAAIGAASSDDDSFDKVNHAATAGLAVVGAGVGALTGYLIGKRSRKDTLIYQAN